VSGTSPVLEKLSGCCLSSKLGAGYHSKEKIPTSHDVKLEEVLVWFSPLLLLLLLPILE
jgi:hypothetical protein